ncbi:hypothetical protein PVAND_002790 [Polypedilum vanderplanki]|uniref:Uncharacterized protein n=1 Tax=Polypedilum vanderplanki TaxID=319348 RepID=A0A9J6BS72_POLVA|nr:hypothetical protein PVAND_002790 [Polypedilum vanderplanki]
MAIEFLMLGRFLNSSHASRKFFNKGSLLDWEWFELTCTLLITGELRLIRGGKSSSFKYLLTTSNSMLSCELSVDFCRFFLHIINLFLVIKKNWTSLVICWMFSFAIDTLRTTDFLVNSLALTDRVISSHLTHLEGNPQLTEK